MRHDLRTLGILGGMGPEATALLFNLIIEKTPARRDSDHIPLCIYNLPQIPDRSQAILQSGPSPVPMLRRGIALLEKTPACCVLIPCNTAFYFYREFSTGSRLPIVHLVKAVVMQIRATYGNQAQKIGILGTSGTRAAQVYDTVFREFGCRAIYPSAIAQEALMQEIYRIKAGKKTTSATVPAAKELQDQGADCLVLACTEISLVHDVLKETLPLVDSLRTLADVGVKIALGKAQPEEYLL